MCCPMPDGGAGFWTFLLFLLLAAQLCTTIVGAAIQIESDHSINDRNRSTLLIRAALVFKLLIASFAFCYFIICFLIIFTVF